MRDIHFNNFNQMLVSTLDRDQLGLANGKMGYCIYFFWLNRIENNEEYNIVAERLIDDILENIDTLKSIDIKNGLAGIGLGINYLIEEGYVTGNVNILLKNIDDLIFKHLNLPKYYTSINPLSTTQLLYYLCIRLKGQKEHSESEYLFKELIIKTVNNLYEKINLKFSEEALSYNIDYLLPQFLYVLSKIYSLNFYNYRILKILEEMTPLIRSTIPLLHCNRLYLLWGLDSIDKQVEISGWRNHIKLLRRECHIEIIFNEELSNNNIFFYNGVASIYFLITGLHRYFTPKEISQYNQQIKQKIESSEIWNILETDPYYFEDYKGLLNGFCGVSVLHHIIK